VKILEAKCERVITELSWGLLLVSIFSGVDADEEVLFNVVYQAWLLSLSLSILEFETFAKPFT
jgi:hypothetical protein